MRSVFIQLFFIIIKNLHSINWTKEFNGISYSEKINLSNGKTIPHYKTLEIEKIVQAIMVHKNVMASYLLTLLKKLKIGKCW